MARRLLIRADASRSVGGGHVQRCLSLAQPLHDRGWECLLAGDPETPDIVPLPAWVSFHPLAGRDEPQAMDVDLLIVDNYRLDAAFERNCRSWARRILVVDDGAERRHECDLLLDQAAGLSTADYRGLVPPSCQLLLGPLYAIVRPEFARLRPESLARRRRPGRRLLINFGASDMRSAGGMVLSALARAGGAPVDLDLVMGRVDAPLGPLRDLAAAISGHAAVHGQVSNMADLMSRADLAIGAGGSASWERCTLGLPAILLSVAANQRHNAASLASAGAALDLGDIAEAAAVEAARSALALLDDPGRLRAMSSRAAALCAGDGAERVADIVEKAVTD
jgi:UDP-2,4-diacetamido-2,4,6-trideoxy-beta-L-altropyranose hydrolase